MNRHSFRLFPVLLALILGGLTLFLEQLIALLPLGNAPKNPATVEYQVENFTASMYAPDGKLYRRVNGQRLWQFPDQDEIHIQQPHFFQYNGDHLLGEIIGSTARYDRRKEEAWFDGPVQLIRHPSADKPRATLDSSQLQIDTVRRFARSSANTVYREGSSVIQSRGFSYDDIHQKLLLNARVKVIHDKNN